jgi:hypothetical protein
MCNYPANNGAKAAGLFGPPDKISLITLISHLICFGLETEASSETQTFKKTLISKGNNQREAWVRNWFKILNFYP